MEKNASDPIIDEWPSWVKKKIPKKPERDKFDGFKEPDDRDVVWEPKHP